MQQHLKKTLDDKAQMTRFCENIGVNIVASAIITDLVSADIPQNAVIKNARGCCGVYSVRGSKDAVATWVERQSRRKLPSSEWILQDDLGPRLDEIRLVFGIHDDYVRRVWCNTEWCSHLEEIALSVLRKAMRTSKDRTVEAPFCVAFDFLADGRLLEVNVEGCHFNACPCRGRIERKARRVPGARCVRGFLKA